MKKTFTEDELEEGGEEEQPQPESGGRKRTAEAQPHDDDDDDDANSDEDLPEVFTMLEGKSMAQKLRNEEKESGRRIAAEVKKKKQERAESRKKEKAAAKLNLPPQEELTARINEADQEKPNMNGLLDDTIVQFLSAREKAELDEVKLVSSPPAVVKVKRLKTKKEKSNSRVQVVDLNRNSPFTKEHNAVEFKQGHLYGNRIRRDPCMLRRLARVP